MEVCAEQNLRELAEVRTGRLSRDVTKLASNTTLQQLTIEQLSRRLEQARSSLKIKEKLVKRATSRTAEMHSRMKGEGGSVVLLAPDSPDLRKAMRHSDSANEGADSDGHGGK